VFERITGPGSAWAAGGPGADGTDASGADGVLPSRSPATSTAATFTPDTAIPDTAIPDTAIPDTAIPDTAIPDTAIPDSAIPDSAIPDSAIPDSAIPDSAIPDSAIPDSAIPDSAIPDSAISDFAMSDIAMSDTAMSDTAMSDTAMSDTAMSDTSIPDTAVSDTSMSDPSTSADVFVAALIHMVKVGASDLHLKTGSRPLVRVGGRLRPCPLRKVDADDCESIVAASIPAGVTGDFALRHEAGYALAVAGLGRFRVSAFRERGRPALVVRLVAASVPTAEALGLLPAVQALAACPVGLVVVAGRAGSGTTTTTAWLVDRINRTRTASIVTIEDPIEYLHVDRRSIVHQREVGTDTAGPAEALRAARRQDPDVLVLGDIADEDTVWAALDAARTALVLVTLTAATAGEAVEHLIGLVAADDRPRARRSLAATLEAVVCQRLVPASRPGRPLLAQEVLRATGLAAHLGASTPAAGSVIDLVAAGADPGTISFDEHLAALHHAGLLTRAEALGAATDPYGRAFACLRRESTSPA
jgi:twitching motility protein PilT